ncbi:MAG TPA: hypothetical protein VF252_04395 [Gemmatimonadales bacterium]
MNRISRIRVPAALTAFVVIARVASVPALSDPVAGVSPAGLQLEAPWLYLVFAPVFTLWDAISMLSISRLKGFLAGLAVLYLIWRLFGGHRPFSALREVGTLVGALALLLAFLAAGALWHRPMLALAGTGRDDLVVDFHSHTNLSHDVRGTLMRGFDAEANRRWHARAGFDVAFITDHNLVSRESGVGSDPTVLCPGIEVSAWRAHIVLLGDTLPVDRRRYNGSFDALLALLQTSDSAYGSLSVASLPEYRRNHWGRLDALTRAGLDGFEIVNASPKANEITQAERDTVIALARAQNRFVVGVSDSHGWGATSMVWNLVRGAADPRAEDVCATVLNRLHAGFTAVRVIERHRLRPDAWWPLWLTPVGVVWEEWRSMGWALAASWLVWIWAISLRTSLGRTKIRR